MTTADKRKTSIKTKRRSGTPDLSGWSLEAMDELTDMVEQHIAKIASEAIRLALEDEYNTRVRWPAIYGDGDGELREKFVKDPLTIYLQIGLGNDENNEPVRAFSLKDALSNNILDCKEDGSYSAGLIRIRDALRRLADDIDRAVAPWHAT